jgi:hypothetical protein
MRYVLGK